MADFGSHRMWGLKEISLPDPISWWPATSGWLVGAVCVLAIIGWASWRGLLKWHRESHRRETLARFDAMCDAKEPLTQLPLLLRSTALSAFPREEVARLRGEEWVDWLNENDARFESGDAKWLDRLPYDENVAEHLPPEVATRLLNASRHWVRNYRARI